MSTGTALIKALRPHQWTKNGLLFAGALFSQTINEPDVAYRAVLGFIAFCLLSGSVYLFNDLRDLEADRLHPVKKNRPLASGDLSQGFARFFLVIALSAAGALSLWLGPTFAISAACYLAINVFYSLWVKRMVVLDVVSIALGFVVRAIAGVELIRPVHPDVALSPWLLVCTFFLALFLGFGKRRQEIVGHADRATEQRAVLRLYSVELLDVLHSVCAGMTLVAYTIYTIWPATVAKMNSEALLYTVPFVTYGLFRYLWLVRVGNDGEDPSSTLVRDRPLLMTIVVWVVAVAAIVYRSGS